MIPPVAIDRAVETVSRLELMTEAGPERIGRPDAEFILSACASVIAEAAYKAGLEAEREKLTDFRVRLEDLTAGMSMDPRMPKEAISALRSFISEVAAIDKEGEN